MIIYSEEWIFMLGKMLAGAVCTAVAASALVSCTDKKGGSATEKSSLSVTEEAVTTTEQATTQPPTVENVDIANFTAPEKGDTIIEMDIKDYGTVKFRLFPEYADKGVENFVELAKKGYYDGLKFHRVISDFMIQGGDPLGNGTGGESIWGGKFDGGTDPHLIHAAGALAYANRGSTSTDGSQFYVVTGTVYTDSKLDELAAKGYVLTDNAREVYKTAGGAPWLDGSYTVFGQVIDGLDVIFRIQNVSVDPQNDSPLKDVVINSVKVGEYNGEDIHWYISEYEAFDPEAIKEASAKDSIDIKNFTAPREGETIVTMKVKGYDGEIKIKLFPEYAEKGVESFITLAQQGYYDNLIFHKVRKDKLVETGDPTGEGTGGSSIFEKGYEADANPHLINAAGAVAYANEGSTNTNGSRFFIVTGEKLDEKELKELEDGGYALTDDEKKIYSEYGGLPWFDGSYTVFGQVFDGLDIVFDIQNAETDSSGKPLKDIVVEKMTVTTYGNEEIHWNISDYK